METSVWGVERMRAADAVWLAVRASRRVRDRRVVRLLRLRGLGLLTVHQGGVNSLAEPAPCRPRPDPHRRRRLLAEHPARQGDPSPGGTKRRPIMTASRQQAIASAAALREGFGRPRDPRPLAPDAAKSPLRHACGWFARVEPGLYRITEAGIAALAHWRVDVPTTEQL